MTDVSSSHAFVRTETIPPSPPPMAETGAVKWMRENLFATVPNAILTILAAYVIFSILLSVVPWLFNGVWNTASLSECREVLDGATGACFSVLTDRWQQLLFGISYPADQYWRPTLAFVLLFFAAAPVLFFDLPRKLLIFTALYPFIAYWLIWGGAFWMPVLLIVGFVLVYLAYAAVLARFGDGPALIAAFAVLVVWFSFGMGAGSSVLDRTLGASRMDAKTIALQEQIDVLPGQITALETRLEALTTEIDGIIDPVRGADEIDAEAVRAAVAEAYPLRAERNATVREIGRLNNDLSEATNLAQRIRQLPLAEESLPALQESFDTLRDSLPDSMGSVIDADSLTVLERRNRDEDLGIDAEDFAVAEEFVEAKAQLVRAERLIERTYNDVARIGLEPIASRNMGGFMLNLMLGVTCVSLSLPIGIALALGRQSSMPFIKWICVIFIEFIRGVPLITLLFVASVMLAYFFPPERTVDFFLRVVIMITIFSAAYIAEVIRGGLAALPKGQYEAADSLGLDYAQAMRLIILPQALKISIPGIVNIAVGLFKDTVLVSVIGMFDILGFIRGPLSSTTAWNGIYWEVLGFASLLFFVTCYGISQYSQWLERRLATDHR